MACLDCAPRREVAFEKLGNILGFVAAYVLGPDPVGRGVPSDLVPAVHEMRRMYTTHRRAMDQSLVKRLGLFDYLRGRLAVAGTPEDCLAQVRAAAQAGVERLMLTVSLAADPVETVELFGRSVLMGGLDGPPNPPDARRRPGGAGAPLDDAGSAGAGDVPRP